MSPGRDKSEKTMVDQDDSPMIVSWSHVLSLWSRPEALPNTLTEKVSHKCPETRIEATLCAAIPSLTLVAASSPVMYYATRFHLINVQYITVFTSRLFVYNFICFEHACVK